MIINRVIDNAAVAAASLTRAPGRRRPRAGRGASRRHRRSRSDRLRRRRRAPAPSGRPGPTASPCASSTTTTPSSPPSTRTRATTSRRSSRSPSTSARTARALVRGIATGYEIQVDLVKAISLHEHKIDHVAHLGPSAAAGIGTLLGLAAETIYQAIGQALHTTTATRQSRKGEISTWKALRARPSPARWRSRRSTARCAARPARPRSTRARTASSPGCSTARTAATRCRCPSAARPSAPSSTATRRSTRPSTRRRPGSTSPASSAREHPELRDPANIDAIVLHTSHHTHYVIGSGANDPQKYDPTASRETLDHSIPYIFAVALQDGAWHHVDSYAPERAARAGHRRAVAQGHHGRGRRVDPPLPLARPDREGVRRPRRDHARPTARRIVDEIAVADAHPLGARPFAREQTTSRKFRMLAERRARAGRDRALPRPSPSACPSSPPPSSAGSPSSPRPVCPSPPKGLF